MSKKRTLVILILVVGILLSLVGGAAARQEKPKFFLIAHGGPGNVFWVTVMKGMADAASPVWSGLFSSCAEPPPFSCKGPLESGPRLFVAPTN